MLRSVWLALVLVVAPATAWAQPGRSAAPPASVEKAQSGVRVAEQRLVQLTNQRVQMTRRYQEQLIAIDRLKKQKPSWRRDRELNSAQADANDTAKRLTVIDNQLKLAQQALARARFSVLAAIDAELPSATGARAEQLARLRAQLAPPAPAPKKIVIPDAEIDPLADPEELERQAAAIAMVEKQLEAQRRGLDQQHRDLQHVAEIRSAHDRAGELSTRDDDQPRRGAPRSNTRATSVGDDQGSAPPQNESAGGGTGSDTSADPSGPENDSIGELGGDKGAPAAGAFESSAAVALGEVIDKSTIEGLLRASRSGNPKQRAEAAKAARDAVAKRLEQLRKKRAIIEHRAKQLRQR